MLLLLPLLQEEAEAQIYDPLRSGTLNRKLANDPLRDPITDVRRLNDINVSLNSRWKSTVNRAVADLGEIAEGQIYRFKVNPRKINNYPANHLFLGVSRVSSILIPENSGIESFNLSTGEFLATLDTKDRYGDYSQEVVVVTNDGVLTFVIKAHIVDAGALKAPVDLKEIEARQL